MFPFPSSQVSLGALLELLAPHLPKLTEAPLRALHQTRDVIGSVCLFAPLALLGAAWLPARVHEAAIFQQSFIDPPKHYTGWYGLTLAFFVLALAAYQVQ